MLAASAIASGGLALSLVAPASTVAAPPVATDVSSLAQYKPKPKPKKVDLSKRVRAAAVMQRLERFQAIADNNDGNRAVGTPGYEASGAYIERVLTKAGYKTKRQYFNAEQFIIDSFSLEVPDIPLDGVVMSYSSSTPEGGVEGELVAPATPLGCDAAAWEGVDATGKIAVVSRGECPFADKALAAGEAGAVGILVYNNAAGPLNGTLGEDVDENSAPAVGISTEEGQALLDAMAEGPVTATLDLQAHEETARTFNVIAETRGGSKDDVLMVGAHLDGVEEGPGINDNGSGSAAILETAVQLAKATGMSDKGKKGKKKPKIVLDQKVRFAWWGAEEIGLVGSWHYVDTLAENNPDKLEAINGYLNFDMIASPNFTVGVYDANESTFEAPVAVPAGSARLERTFTRYFDGNEQPWVDSEYSGRSDYQGFIEYGIPAAGLFSGADDVKTEEEAELFGGEAGANLDPNYHSPDDDIDNVSMKALRIFVPAIAHSVQKLSEKKKRR